MPFESPQRLMGDSFASPSSSMAAPASQIPIIPYEKIDQARIHNTDGLNILMPAPDMPDPTLRPALAEPEMGIEPVEEAPITTMPIKEGDEDPSTPDLVVPITDGGLLRNKKLLIGGGSLVLLAAALGFYFFWYKKKGAARK